MKKFLFFLIIISMANNIYAEQTRSEIVQALFRCVENWFGSPYEYGGTEKQGVDCSAFTDNVYRKVFGIDLPRSVSEQKQVGKLVEDNKFQPGDLLFFNTTGAISHVGIYVFNNKFIHAASSGPEVGVIKSSLDENYYKKRFVYARRVVKLPPFKKENVVEDKNDIKTVEKQENIKKTGDRPEEKKDPQVAEIKSVTDKDKLAIKADIILGRILYKNNILSVSETFKSENPIFLRVKTDDDENKLKLVVENISEKKIEKTIPVKLSDNLFVDELHLTKGNYNIKVLDGNKNVIVMKEIEVL
jgi:hypothetical protein